MNDHPSYKRPESVLVVVHTDTEVLLIKRADHSCFWQSVTGSLERDEQPHDAAVRELHEETAIVVNSLRSTGISRTYAILEEWRSRYQPGVVRNTEHLFYCYLSEKCDVVLDPNEHTDYQWLPTKEARDQVYSWSNRLALMGLVQ